MQKSISIIIPNFNGRNLLEKNLPSVIKACLRHPEDIEIIIVDDGSSDGSAEFIKNNYLQVKLVRLEKNLGFTVTCNARAKVAK